MAVWNPRRRGQIDKGKQRRGLPGAPGNSAERVGVRELRQNLSVYLDRVKDGETLTVTEHGRVVAVLSPPLVGSVLERMVADGRATAPRTALRDIPAPRPAPFQGMSVEALIDELRDERLR